MKQVFLKQSFYSHVAKKAQFAFETSFFKKKKNVGIDEGTLWLFFSRFGQV